MRGRRRRQLKLAIAARVRSRPLREQRRELAERLAHAQDPFARVGLQQLVERRAVRVRLAALLLHPPPRAREREPVAEKQLLDP